MPASLPEPDDLMLGPATRLLWRTRDSVHFELGRDGVIVDGLPPQITARLASRETAPAASLDTASPDARRAMRRLTESGYLWPRGEPGRELDGDDARLAPPAPRLAGELGALAVRHGQRAAQLLSARRHAAVAIRGDDRVAIQIASLLAAAGVGGVDCAPRGTVRLRHVAPGAVAAADEGLDLDQAARRAVRRVAPETDTAPAPPHEPPDLTVLVSCGPVDDDLRDALQAARLAHLAVEVGADHGVVGPLVLPGLTSCLRCADLHRCDRDPAWPALAVQLSVPSRYAPPSDVVVGTLTASVAALQALAFLDGDDPSCVEATLEAQLPDWRLRRRRWPVHPDCGCCAA